MGNILENRGSFVIILQTAPVHYYFNKYVLVGIIHISRNTF